MGQGERHGNEALQRAWNCTLETALVSGDGGGRPPSVNVGTLRAQIKALEAENAALREELRGPEWMPLAAAFELPRYPAKVLTVLLTQRAVTKETLYDALYPDAANRPGPRIIDVYLSKLRTVLSPHGISIRRIQGTLIGISEEDKQRLQGWLAAQAVADSVAELVTEVRIAGMEPQRLVLRRREGGGWRAANPLDLP